MKRPMFCGALIACVCVIVSYINIKTTLLCGVGLICFLLMIITDKMDTRRLSAFIAATLVFCSLINSYKTINKIDRLSGEQITETFDVTDIKRTTEYCGVTVSCISGKVLPRNTKLSLYANTDYSGLSMGDRLTGNIKISTVSSRDNKAYYYSKGIYAVGNLVNVSERHSDNIFLRRAGNVKRFVKMNIAATMSEENAATLLGLTIGDKDLFSPQFAENVKRTGVSHIMVVSGMHLTIILGALFWVLDRIFYNSYIRFIVSFIAIAFIVSICGFTLSIIRAGLMFFFMALAPLLKRDSDSLNSLGTAIIIMSIFCPFAILNVGFQLSALATFGIIYIVPFIESSLKVKNPLIRDIILALSVTLSATITTLPVSIYYFGYISLVAPLTNILLSFAVTCALCIGIIGLILRKFMFLRMFSDMVMAVCEAIVSYINYIINSLGNWQLSAISAGKFAFWLSLVFAVSVVLFIYTCKTNENLLKSMYNKKKEVKK